ncbi:MAG: o-succinylbenzoate synthase [Egibacteraceae bacterium]
MSWSGRDRPGRALRPFAITLRTRFRGVDARAGVLVQGPVGWGEFSPFPDYGPEVAARWLAAAREAAFGSWPVALREEIPVNTTVPAVDPETAHAMVTASGCATAKVKVAERGEGPQSGLAADLARVEAVRDALGTAGRIRVDANGAWDVNGAVRAIAALDRFDLEYVEQPVATLEEMARVRRRVDVPLAADESVRTAADPLRVAGLEAADIVVLKVQPLGGVWAALEVADAAGLPAVVSSAVETSIGLAAGLALAAALPELPYACGLGTATLLAADVAADPLVPRGGSIAVRRPVPDADALAACAPDEAQARALLARLAEAGAAADPDPARR